VKISVIICTYNYAHYLFQCLQSVINQTYPPDEVIVIDDGSIDETFEVIRHFEGIKYIRQEHAGKAAAFNRGIEASSGDLICHLDADDYWFERKLEYLLNTFQRFPNAGGIIHDAVIIYDDEAPPRDLPDGGPPKPMSLQDVILSAFCYLPKHYRKLRGYYYDRWPITPFAGGISVRRDVIEPYIPFPININLSVDGLLLFIASTFTLIYLPQVLSIYRHHGRNYWRSNPYAMKGQIRLYQWLISNSTFLKYLTNKQQILFLAKLIEDAFLYELRCNERLCNIPRLALPSLLISAGVLPGWKHWAISLAFPLVKIMRKVVHHLKGKV
jgi:glycosyltransferase involved in cell wall biosynthesis